MITEVGARMALEALTSVSMRNIIIAVRVDSVIAYLRRLYIVVAMVIRCKKCMLLMYLFIRVTI